MKKNWHRIMALALTACLTASIFLGSGFSSYAVESEDKTSAISEETVSDQQDEVNAEDSEQTSVIDEQQEETEESSESQENTEEKTEPQESAEEKAEPQTSASEAQTEQNLKENSWRYSNGQLILNNYGISTYSATNAWEKVNGRYVNSKGDPIPGAEKKGIDVSEWQGKIDWSKAKADGVEYAIIRIGWHANSSSYVDKMFEYNVSECERLGIPYGIYLYSYITTTTGASKAASFVINHLAGHTPSYPVYLDLEDNTTINSDHASIAKTFLDKITASGYRGGVYANLNWWTHYLTSPVFNNAAWSKWVAQYNYACTYSGTYDMWQCTQTGRVDGISGTVDLNFWMVKTDDVEPVEVQDSNIVTYSSHLQTFGWQAEVRNGYETGVTGYGKRLEAIKINVGKGYGDLGVKYSTYVQSYGWMDYVDNGNIAGTTGEGKTIEAIKIELTGTEANKYDIYYRAHCQTFGWLDWAKNGQAAGTEGYSKRMEALQIAVVPKGTAAPGSTETSYMKKGMSIIYSTYINGKGWTDQEQNGALSGTTGQSAALEGFKVTIENPEYTGSVNYEAYMQTYRWNGQKSDGQYAGMPGSGKRMEAVKISLSGEIAKYYDIYYRAYVQTFGWLDWTKNGQAAGTFDYGKRMEALEVKLVKKGSSAPGSTSQPSRQAELKYSTHLQTYGWGQDSFDGEISGITGKQKRMEAIKIDFANSNLSGNILYKTHLQTYGWDKDWTKNDGIAGTVGQSKRLEALCIKLTGKVAEQYDIYYRVHCQTYGWLGWTKNGEPAGTEGLKKRVEAVQIELVKKGEKAPETTGAAFIK